MRWRWECHWCSYRILTSSLTYDWVDPWQHKFILVYMITKKNSMLMTRSSRRLSCNTSYERITYRWMDPCNFFSKKDWKNRLTPTVSKIISYSYRIKFVHASCANAFLIAQRWFRCFCLTMLNPSVNSPKIESESPQFEIAARKKTFEDFQSSLKRSMIDVYVSSNDGEVRRLAIFQQGTLNILQFYGNSYDDPRQEADKSLQQLWSLLCKDPGLVSLKEKLVSFPPTQLYYVEASFKLQELKFQFKISILVITLPPEGPLLARD